jgi:hypothetical protein
LRKKGSKKYKEEIKKMNISFTTKYLMTFTNEEEVKTEEKYFFSLLLKIY